jgi:serine protease
MKKLNTRSKSLLVISSSILLIGLSLLFISSIFQPVVTASADSPLNVNKQRVKNNNKEKEGELNYIPGEVIVKFKSSLDTNELKSKFNINNGSLSLPQSQRLSRIFQRARVKNAQQIFSKAKSENLQRIFKITSEDKSRLSTEKLVSELAIDPDIAYAHPNYIMEATSIPNDPYYSTSGSWGQSYEDLWGLYKINAAQGWDKTKGAGVIVAVIDSGVDYTHEDIAANIWQNQGEIGVDAQGRDKKSNGVDDDNNSYIDDWHGYDFVTIDETPEDNDPMDGAGHGTHVAGTIAAIGNNGLGIVGVAPEAKIMALKGLSDQGYGSTENLVKAIYYAADNGAKVINASWGRLTDEPINAYVDAISYAHDVKGAVVVAAAGNSSADVNNFSPAHIRDTIAVSASTNNDDIAEFSNVGLGIDVAAPGGGDIDPTGTISNPARSVLSLLCSQPSSDLTKSGALVVGSKYLRQAGTSMAAPHVSGLAALVKSLHPEFSAEQIRQAIRVGSDDIGPSGFDKYFGYGRINVAKTLDQIAPLAVEFSYPNPVLKLHGVNQVDIRGTVSGPALSSWELRYGEGTSPTQWTVLYSSTSPVTEGLLMNWDLNTVSDGTYTLLLTARNTDGQTFEDRLLNPSLELDR